MKTKLLLHKIANLLFLIGCLAHFLLSQYEISIISAIMMVETRLCINKLEE